MDYPEKSQVCPHCKRVAAFDVVHRVRLSPEFSAIVAAWDEDFVIVSTDQYLEMPHDPYEVCLVVFRCQGCRQSSTFHEYRLEIPALEAQPNQIKDWFVLSYPKRSPRRLEGEGVPEPVRSFYEEGGVAEAAGAPRAAGAMFRGAVEAICDALEVPRKVASNGRERLRNLRERVDDLVGKGLDEEVVADLHEARLVGNDSLHDGLSYASDELADVAELIAEAVQLAFVQPAERRAMREARKARREAHRIDAQR